MSPKVATEVRSKVAAYKATAPARSSKPRRRMCPDCDYWMPHYFNSCPGAALAGTSPSNKTPGTVTKCRGSCLPISQAATRLDSCSRLVRALITRHSSETIAHHASCNSAHCSKVHPCSGSSRAPSSIDRRCRYTCINPSRPRHVPWSRSPPHPWDVSHSAGHRVAYGWHSDAHDPVEHRAGRRRHGAGSRRGAIGTRLSPTASGFCTTASTFLGPTSKQYRREVEAATARLLEAVPATTSEDQ